MSKAWDEEEIVSRVRTMMKVAVQQNNNGNPPEKGKKDAAEKWKQLFLKYDADKTGQLSFQEINRALRRDLRLSRSAVSDRDLRVLFQRMDLDKSGTLEFKEFYTYVAQGRKPGEDQTLEQVMIKIARAMKLALARMRMKDVDDLKQVFQDFDIDGGGTFSQDELRDFFRRFLRLNEHEISEVAISKAFKSIDTDSSKTVSWLEFNQFVKSSLEVQERHEKEVHRKELGGNYHGGEEAKIIHRRRLSEITRLPCGHRNGCFAVHGRELVPRSRILTGAPKGSFVFEAEPLAQKNAEKARAKAASASPPPAEEGEDHFPSRPQSRAESGTHSMHLPLAGSQAMDDFELRQELLMWDSENAFEEPSDGSPGQPLLRSAASTVSLPQLPQGSPRRRGPASCPGSPAGAGSPSTKARLRLPGEQQGYQVLKHSAVLNRMESRLFEAGIDLRGNLHRVK